MAGLAAWWRARLATVALVLPVLVLPVLVITLLPVTAAARSTLGLPDFTALVKKNHRAVVNVSFIPDATSVASDAPASPLDEQIRRFREEAPGIDDADSQGSGFIISRDGYILTNNHVVQGVGEVMVSLHDRRQLRAEVIGADPRSDIALLKVDADNLPVVSIGNSKALEVGEWVLAIGSPFGFDFSVTAGIVSAIGRSLPSENYVPFIQTDVAINPGNSGGPLFNL
ncbi:MAG: serine peptidase, partial [Gammaproteobacteria bacterium]